MTSVHEMLHVAREVSPGDTAAHLLTFGEFCLFATELRQCYDRETPRPPLLSKLSDKSCTEKKRSERKMSTESLPKYEVFLGGSCNPTTWRQTVAIPMLKDHGISFYNPQVLHWEEALVEVEYQAKQTASVLFFVLDHNTRNVASMVEAAYLAGRRRKLVIVVDTYTGPGQLINGEPISEQEYQDLTSGLNTVQDLVERQGIPVFAEINHALNCTAKILRDNIHPQDLGTEDQVQPIKYPYLQLGDKLIQVHDAFVNTNSEPEQITLADARVAYKVVTNKELTTEELQNIVAFKKGWALPRRPLRPLTSSGGRDLYLGGSLGSRVTWREQIAIPLLLKHGLSYFNPAAGACSGRLLPMEAVLMEHSRVLLFVITDNTRGVSAMAMASHYIGLGCNVVLCIQMLTEDSLVNGEQLSRLALKDYNRGRSYLTDQANKDGIPVFSDTQEAVECAINKVASSR
ncbi:hypothetical protein Pmani_026134 [Petrolisthes manimaculis]|uniref:Uncharacterized protein n=1 Tax=Petrolisthes manimaculis TaxID=1843537 RepID=A0AAE1P4Q0_9EUCA|nr:hypothetical protein Pmani_026134 [Petrolisthes manimaculis]